MKQTRSHKPHRGMRHISPLETNSFTLASCPTKTGTIRWMLNEVGDDWPSEVGQHFLPYLPTPPLLLCRQTLQCGSGAVHTYFASIMK